MSQASTASKHNHANPSNHQLVELVPTGGAASNLTPSELTSQEQCPSSGHDQHSISHSAMGCEVSDTYLDHDDKASVDDRLDFSQCKVPDRDVHIESLHKVYNFVCQGLDRRMDKRQGETSVASIIGGSSGTGKSTLIKQFQDELREKSQVPGGPCMPFLIEDKFDELIGADPFSAIVQAFTRFAEGMMQRDTHELERIRSCVSKQLGTEAALLTAVVPKLKVVIDCVLLAPNNDQSSWSLTTCSGAIRPHWTSCSHC